MNLEILTPEKKVFAGEVELVRLPGTDGSFAVKKNHAPLISSLQAGQIKIKQNMKETSIVVKSGFVEVLNNKVTVLVEGAS